ncbi:MAG TPA: HEAT repeat domain-containing protein [Candidatus Methanoperedens sp.]
MVLISQRKIHRMAQSKNWDERRQAANFLSSNFEVLPDKEQAWNDLHRLTLDKAPDVRVDAVRAVGITFPNIPNKKQGWKDIHRLTRVKVEYVREYAALALGYAFPHIPDKGQAWNDLQRLSRDEEPEVLESVAMSLNAAFPDISDKEQAWEHLVRLAQYNYYDVLFAAIDALGDVYSDILDKEQAWEDIFWLTQEGEDMGRARAVYALGVAFPYHPNKQRAWENLHQVTLDKYKDILESSAYTLGVIFPHAPNKEEVWADLHRLTLNEENFVRKNAARAIGLAYPHILDKEQALADLHRLTEDLDSNVRFGAAIALGSVFPHIPEKEQAWKDITRLLQDDTSYVQSAAVITMGIVFPHLPNKEQAWFILHCYIRYLRHDSAIAIGLAFPYVPDKKQACKDLMWLAHDKDTDVRGAANYSLGKAFIFKATEAECEDDFRKELEKALEFFEKSSKDATYHNPARFCLPFYRSLYTITFKKQVAAIEVEKYFIEAKIASEGSESREKLLEAVENLGNALKEVQKACDFNIIKSDLNAYRRYCDRVCELLDATEEEAPGATRLIRRGLPIIDQNIKEILADIQENAKSLCKHTHGTQFEDLGREVNYIGQNLLQIRDLIGLEKGFDNLHMMLSIICSKLPEEERGEACELLNKANDEQYIEDRLPLINMILSKISSQMSSAKNIDILEKKLDEMLISLKPGIREELILTVGAEIFGTGAQHIVTIPIQEISYPELKKDLDNIKGKSMLKLDTLPLKLAQKVKSYIIRNKIGPNCQKKLL